MHYETGAKQQPHVRKLLMRPAGIIVESISGIVDRVTYHNPNSGWSVLRVLPFDNPHHQEMGLK